ncbi:MAG: DNA/RNA nuclease SfsA, partial [Thermodesulforhabdaceae bacterium]
PVLLHTHYTNDVAEQLIRDGSIPGMEGYDILGREVPLNGGRIDFLLKTPCGKRLFLEVKSCTLFGDDIAMFPDAVTDRGRRHVEKLASIAANNQDTGAGILFVIHAGHVTTFLPDFHTDPAFSRTLYTYRNHITLKAVSVMWDGNLKPRSIKPVEIGWNIYEKEAGDRGTYLIIGFLPENLKLEIGSLGERLFRKGYYIYVGSAMNSLSHRIRRHLLRRKTAHWHIDSLTPFLNNLFPIRIESEERLECSLATKLCAVADSIVSRFGSSDCGCPGHLFWMASNPIHRESFVNLLIDFRINRLSRLRPDIEQE